MFIPFMVQKNGQTTISVIKLAMEISYMLYESLTKCVCAWTPKDLREYCPKLIKYETSKENED